MANHAILGVVFYSRLRTLAPAFAKEKEAKILMIEPVVAWEGWRRRLAQVVADFNRRQEDAAHHRRIVRHALEQARAQALAVAEAAREGERRALSRRIFSWAAEFIHTPEGCWAFAHWHRWRLAWDLDLDARGCLYKASDAHWFGRVPARLITSPEELAGLYSTAKLHDAVAATEQQFWSQALSRELACLLLPRGRPVE